MRARNGCSGEINTELTYAARTTSRSRDSLSDHLRKKKPRNHSSAPVLKTRDASCAVRHIVGLHYLCDGVQWRATGTDLLFFVTPHASYTFYMLRRLIESTLTEFNTMDR